MGWRTIRREQKQPPLYTTSLPRPRRSISTRLRWSYLISSTLPLIVVGALLIFLNFQTQQELVFSEQITLAARSVRDISTYVSDMETQLLRTGRDLQNATFRDERNAMVREIINVNFPNLRTVSVFNVNRAEITHLSLEQTYSPDSYLHRTDDPLVIQALQGSGSRGDIYLTEDGEPVFPIVLPLRNSERTVVGAIKAEVSATPIVHALRTTGRDSDNVAYLVNKNQSVMLQSTIFEQQPDLEEPTTLVNTTIVETESTAEQEGYGQVVSYRNHQGTRVLSVVAPINPGNWSVIIEKPFHIAFGNVWNNVILLCVLVGMVGLMGLGWGLLLAQSFLLPLQALRQGAIALGQGQLEHRIDVKGNDEMSQLAQTFNHMAEQLQSSLSEIEHQNDRLREGLVLARDIQMGLLPTHPPWNQDTIRVGACSLPAYEVGGDFYSYLSLPNNQVAISIGDISGKGVSAALMMALTSSMVESQARQLHQPSEVLMGLNRMLHPRFQTSHMNAALLYAVFDLHSHTMTVANAGMIAPLLIRRQREAATGDTTTHTEFSSEPPICRFIDIGGLPIGSMTNATYLSTTEPLEPGDIILLMSDGVVEAHNEAGEMFGFERIENLFHNLQFKYDVHMLVDFILEQVQTFIGNAEQHDDITIVAVSPSVQEESDGWGRDRLVHASATVVH